jgi:hypothetical protein
VSGNLYDSYVSGKNAMRAFGSRGQSALLEADGELGSNTKQDLIAARGFSIGKGIALASDSPEINAVSAPRTVTGAETVSLEAFQVSGTSPIKRVWANVNSPDRLILDADRPVVNLELVELKDEDGDDNWEGFYSDFSIKGTYEFQIFAENENGFISVPTTQKPNKTVVIQTEGREPITGRDSDSDGVSDSLDEFPLDPDFAFDADGDRIPDEIDNDKNGDGLKDAYVGPDIYESDDALTDASFINIGSQVQEHNFDSIHDVDTIWFYAEAGVHYLVDAYPVADQLATGPDIQISLFGTDDRSFSKRIEDLNFGGVGETYELESSVSGVYTAKIEQSTVLSDEERLEGPRTGYELKVSTAESAYTAGDIKVEIESSLYAVVSSEFSVSLKSVNLGPDTATYESRLIIPRTAQISQLNDERCGIKGRILFCSLGELAKGEESTIELSVTFEEVSKRVQLTYLAFPYANGQQLLEVDQKNNDDVITVTVSEDSDDDGLPDEYELRKGLSVGVDDSGSDFDSDGVSNIEEYMLGTDPSKKPVDTDGDGVRDLDDAFPLDASETIDTDSDGTGNNADTDDDGDGVADGEDAFPLDKAESVDTDGDGIGNNADNDDDGDGVPDTADGYALISLGALLDTDSDGFPNECDEDCLATGMTADSDDDNDGVEDTSDAFPLDASETADSDSDGVGDNSDAFPNDATESLDSDSDSVGDNADNCPSLSNSDQLNTDGDTEGDACDSDDDNDGFSDEEELTDGTDPLSRFSCKSGCFSFDVDENLEAQPLTDGLLVIRHLFGFSGDSLTSGAVSSEASRDSSEAIAGYLTEAVSELDIDGDGESKPLTDGLLLIRYLFGFSGDSLISGAIGSGAERDTADEVEAYIKERVPVQ